MREALSVPFYGIWTEERSYLQKIYKQLVIKKNENESKQFTSRQQGCHFSKIRFWLSMITKMFVSMKWLIFVSYTCVTNHQRMIPNIFFVSRTSYMYWILWNHFTAAYAFCAIHQQSGRTDKQKQQKDMLTQTYDPHNFVTPRNLNFKIFGVHLNLSIYLTINSHVMGSNLKINGWRSLHHLISSS